MNKNFRIYAILWGISLAIFNGVAFALPSELVGENQREGSFWIGYAFITLAFIGQLVTGYFSLKEENLKKLFYNISMLSVSRIGLVLTLVFGTLCMVIPGFPSWISVIICFAVLGFTAIAVSKASLAADLVSEINNKVKSQTFFIKALAADAETLMSHANTPVAQKECKKVYETIRYSDPMSNANLASLEAQINIKFSEFSNAVKNNDSENITNMSKELIILITDRNNKCKLLE